MSYKYFSLLKAVYLATATFLFAVSPILTLISQADEASNTTSSPVPNPANAQTDSQALKVENLLGSCIPATFQPIPSSDVSSSITRVMSGDQNYQAVLVEGIALKNTDRAAVLDSDGRVSIVSYGFSSLTDGSAVIPYRLLWSKTAIQLAQYRSGECDLYTQSLRQAVPQLPLPSASQLPLPFAGSSSEPITATVGSDGSCVRIIGITIAGCRPSNNSTSTSIPFDSIFVPPGTRLVAPITGRVVLTPGFTGTQANFPETRLVTPDTLSRLDGNATLTQLEVVIGDQVFELLNQGNGLFQVSSALASALRNSGAQTIELRFPEPQRTTASQPENISTRKSILGQTTVSMLQSLYLEAQPGALR
jgi:hypothetical protein